ncbi:MAG: adenosylcobalamin-dependent ribonucleoside-diphosphate reductase [Bdellovibrio sp.]|nr:adenosylcobalamin-dependent ribonucleoside-diphosphate reductase [Bdellovibrio sp.]
MTQYKAELTESALAVLQARYLQKESGRKRTESAEDLFRRVAQFVASVEGKERKSWEKRFFEMMVSLRFLPNSPTLMNAGMKEGQLSACFVLPIEDSLASIFEALKNAALIHQSGGGTGFSFSNLRPRGSEVNSTRGVASGPVSFMRVFDVATETIKQGGKRRGANMAILRVDHPDVLEFIDSKRDLKSITNFNISVGITEAFMQALRANENYSIRVPSSGWGIEKKSRSLNAKSVFQKLVQAAWECGDPGLVFLDRINLFNPTPLVGEIESTNPCSEQPLLPFESCNLGSLNLLSYLGAKGLDWVQFREDVFCAVRFLDNVIDLNAYPVKECAKITKRNRKVGLGIMGFADLLLAQGIPYDSSRALALGTKVMSFLDRTAKQASVELATHRGGFPNWKGSLWQRLGYPKMRNATVSTVAPTGTISLIAGVSSGIEPIYAGVIARNVLSGKRLVQVHPLVGELLKRKKLPAKDLTEESLPRLLGDAWSPSHSLSVRAHIQMQAVFQQFSDSAVSKTVNLPEGATPEDVAKAYWMAYQLGCKGITVYRDKSRPTQVLERADQEAETPDHCPSC